MYWSFLHELTFKKIPIFQTEIRYFQKNSTLLASSILSRRKCFHTIMTNNDRTILCV